MKARIKFRKYGAMKFIGHLDVMRFFQKAMRRAEIPIAFTGGFSPHMIMSFANPLGVGVTSDAEYFDIELAEDIDLNEAKTRLNSVMVEGIDIVNVVAISDDKKKTGMSIVAAADYLSKPKYDSFPRGWQEMVQSFWNQSQILIVKATKKSEKEVDIKPMIYELEAKDNALFMKVATGSVENLKPELVMKAFAKFLGLDDENTSFSHHRLEIYANQGTEGARDFIPLDKMTV